MAVQFETLNVKEVQELTESASQFIRLRFLRLHAAAFDENAFGAIGEACQDLQQLDFIELEASKGNLSAAGATRLVQALQTSRLTRIGLHQLAHDEAAASRLFEVIEQRKQLRELRLSGPLSKQCVMRLSAMLNDPASTLNALDLNACALDEACVLALAHSLRANVSLHELRLARFSFTDQGAKALTESIAASTSLLALRLDEGDFSSPNQLRNWSDALMSNLSLRELHLNFAPEPNQNRDQPNIAAIRFVNAAARSNNLLQMTISPEGSYRMGKLRQKLTENRKRLEAGIAT